MRVLHGLIAALLFVFVEGSGQSSVQIGALRDNTLFEDTAGAFSNGLGPNFYVGRNNLAQLRRGVVEFDVAGSVPANVVVDSVRIHLYMSQSTSGPVTIDLHRVMREWGEGTSSTTGGMGAPSTPGDATWIHALHDSVFWDTPGGDFDSGISASQIVDGVGAYQWGTTAELVADVQSWLDDPSTNHGWILIGNEVVNQTAKRFETRENAVIANRPVLTVWYSDSPTVIPCEEIDFFGAKCKGNGDVQAMVRLLNSTQYAGEDVRFQLDSTVYPVELMTNGTHTIARLQVPQAGPGPHTMTLLLPSGCFDPVMLNCPVGRQRADSEEFDDLWAEAEAWVPARETASLKANYPNPFNPATTIGYELVQGSHVTLKVFNLLGQEIATLVDGFEPAGSRTVRWNGVNSNGNPVPSGMYFYRLTAGSVVQIRSMILSK